MRHAPMIVTILGVALVASILNWTAKPAHEMVMRLPPVPPRAANLMPEPAVCPSWASRDLDPRDLCMALPEHDWVGTTRCLSQADYCAGAI